MSYRQDAIKHRDESIVKAYLAAPDIPRKDLAERYNCNLSVVKRVLKEYRGLQREIATSP